MFRKTLLLLVISLWSTLAFGHVVHRHKPDHSVRHHRTAVSHKGVKRHVTMAPVQHESEAHVPHYLLLNLVSAKSSEECLATAIYWESKSEPAIGKAAVGYVIYNRTVTGQFPKTVCGVVYQHGVDKQGNVHYQFPWSRHGSPARINPQQMTDARTIARAVLNRTVSNPIGDALYFNEASLALAPSRHAPYRKVIGRNAFYSPKPYELASR